VNTQRGAKLPSLLRHSEQAKLPRLGVKKIVSSCKKYCVLYGILAYFPKIPRSFIKALKEGEATFKST